MFYFRLIRYDIMDESDVAGQQTAQRALSCSKKDLTEPLVREPSSPVANTLKRLDSRIINLSPDRNVSKPITSNTPDLRSAASNNLETFQSVENNASLSFQNLT